MEEYNTSIEKLRESNMIFIAMHGGVTYFKSLEKIMKKFEGKKNFLFILGVEDENIVLLKNLEFLSPKQYETILSYYSIGG